MKSTHRRILGASRRFAHTSSRLVTLETASGSLLGYALRRTCDEMVRDGLLDEDQDRLGEDGRGSFEFVLTPKAVIEFYGEYLSRLGLYAVTYAGKRITAETPAELAEKISAEMRERKASAER